MLCESVKEKSQEGIREMVFGIWILSILPLHSSLLRRLRPFKT